MNDQVEARTSNERVERMLAAALAHRGCCGTEHDPPNGKLHGCCVVCGVPWPCDTAKAFLVTPVETSGYEELRKRATRLLVAMRRDRWEGHDHGYANSLAVLLNVGSPEEPEALLCICANNWCHDEVHGPSATVKCRRAGLRQVERHLNETKPGIERKPDDPL